MKAHPPERAIVLDTETTGLSPRNHPADRIVEIAACEVVDGQPTGAVFHHYLNPGRRVPASAVAVHGLDNGFLADKPRFVDIAADFIAFIGDTWTPIYAHNAPFDERFVTAELDWANHPTALTFECSLKLARSLRVPTENHKLETLARHVEHDWGRGAAHSAVDDTHALAAVLRDCLWPLAAEQARPRQAKAPSRQAAPADQKAAVALPEGFVPLTAETDARIRRYDDFDATAYCTKRGTRWTPDERRQLVEAFINEGATVETLVERHGRTPTAIFLRLEALGVVAPGHPYDRSAHDDDPLTSPSDHPERQTAGLRGPSL